VLGDWAELEKHEPEYDATGMILPVTLLTEDVDAFVEMLREATRGRGHLKNA
jgi:hypothetical protein